MIETHALREGLIQDVTPDQIKYANLRIGSLVKNVEDALNYLFASLYPDFLGSYATTADLPLTASANQYAFVVDDGDGKSAGYVWISLDGVAAWQKRYDVDWSVENVLADLISQTNPLYIFANGKSGSQTIYGGNAANENLTLNANSFDDSGEIIITNPLASDTDNYDDLGKINKRFKDFYIAGLLKDGTLSISIANVVDAFNHISLTNNPHSVGYDQLINKIGVVTVDGDATGSVDLGASGVKTLTISVVDDSHDHTIATIPSFNTYVYNKVKSILQANDGITFASNDGLETVTPSQADIDTSEITDIDAPVADRILGSSDGSTWSPKKITVQLQGDVTGSADWDSASQKTLLTATVEHVLLEDIEGLDLDNLEVTIAVGSPAVVSILNHRLSTGDKVHINTTKPGTVVPAINAELVVTVLTANTFTIPVSVTTSGNGYLIPNNAQFLYDTNLKHFKIRREFEEIAHTELGDVDLFDDHLQYVAKNGRSGSQSISGGTSSAEDLVLDSTTDAVKGSIRLKSNIAPFASSSYSGGWSGVDLGLSTKTFRNLHMSGEAFGFRVENITTLPSSSGTSVARLVYHTIQDKFYYDSGTAIRPLSNTTLPISIDTYSTVTSKAIDLTSVLDTGKTTADYNWTLWDDSTSQIVFASITRTNSTQVLVTTELPLTGSYKLKGI